MCALSKLVLTRNKAKVFVKIRCQFEKTMKNTTSRKLEYFSIDFCGIYIKERFYHFVVFISKMRVYEYEIAQE